MGDILNSRSYLLFKDTAHESPQCSPLHGRVSSRCVSLEAKLKWDTLVSGIGMNIKEAGGVFGGGGRTSVAFLSGAAKIRRPKG